MRFVIRESFICRSWGWWWNPAGCVPLFPMREIRNYINILGTKYIQLLCILALKWSLMWSDDIELFRFCQKTCVFLKSMTDDGFSLWIFAWHAGPIWTLIPRQWRLTDWSLLLSLGESELSRADVCHSRVGRRLLSFTRRSVGAERHRDWTGTVTVQQGEITQDITYWLKLSI